MDFRGAEMQAAEAKDRLAAKDREIADLRDLKSLLERIATALEALTGAPVNQYGETFVDAIQNGHARGLRGITTYD